MNKYVLMAVYCTIQTDARVIRSAEAINDMGEDVVVISYNSDLNYTNKKFNSIFFTGRKNKLSLIIFWYNVFIYTIKNRKNIKLLYFHDYYLCGIGKILSRIIGVKWVYDAHELLIERKNTKRTIRQKLFSYLEKNKIRKADLVISANSEREKIVRNIYQLKNSIYVLNIAAFNIQDEIAANVKKENIIVYQGYIAKERGIEEYINLLLFLPNNIRLKIIGGGPDIEFFKDLVVKRNLSKRVEFTGKIPYSQLIHENKHCKIGIVSYSLIGLNNFYCSPNKLYDYARLAMPMIFSSQPFLKKISKEYGIGEVFYKDMSYELKAKAVMNIFNNMALYQRNMNCFLSDYSHEREMNKLKQSIRNLLST